MFRRALALLVAAAPGGVAVLSPAWLPAHALRWLRDGLEGVDADDELSAWARSLVFHTDVRAGLSVPGLAEAVVGLVRDGWFVADGDTWVMHEDRRLEQRRAMLALAPEVTAVIAGAAERWQRFAEPRTGSAAAPGAGGLVDAATTG
jgi:hypothetical protein